MRVGSGRLLHERLSAARACPFGGDRGRAIFHTNTAGADGAQAASNLSSAARTPAAEYRHRSRAARSPHQVAPLGTGHHQCAFGARADHVHLRHRWHQPLLLRQAGRVTQRVRQLPLRAQRLPPPLPGMPSFVLPFPPSSPLPPSKPPPLSLSLSKPSIPSLPLSAASPRSYHVPCRP